ncbi:MAG: hypothetical protein MJY79_02945 [Bacteroidaceae bacterium]|nr:hypothetical protein [Bacteroidaceae bacterium]
MKKLVLAAAMLLSVTVQAQRVNVMEEMIAMPQKSFGTDFPYSFDVPALTPSPKGYKPFYISHYARHGSRYYWTKDLYVDIDSMLTQAKRLGTLTEEGKKFHDAYMEAYPELMAGMGELTRVGWDQHQGIARTMYASFPEVFRKGGTVSAISSLSGRCVISMSAFCQALEQCNPKLDIYEQSSRFTLHGVVPTDGENPYKKSYPRKVLRLNPSSIARPAGVPSSEEVVARVFTSTQGLSKRASAIQSDLKNLYTSLPSIGHVGMMGNIMTDQEIVASWENSNFYAYQSFYGNQNDMIPIVEDILDRAKAVVEGESTDLASLRFGHDTCLGPLTILMGINGADTEISDASDVKLWYQNYQTGKAANIQFIFYRSKKNPEILVKCLLNGEEATLPLPGDGTPYYKWSDFYSYYRNLCDAAGK